MKANRFAVDSGNGSLIVSLRPHSVLKVIFWIGSHRGVSVPLSIS